MTANRIKRPEAKVIAEEEFRRFAELVASFSAEEWTLPTDCDGWDVRKMVLHVLGSGDAQASFPQFVHQLREGRAAHEIRAGHTRGGDDRVRNGTILFDPEDFPFAGGGIVNRADRFRETFRQPAFGRAIFGARTKTDDRLSSGDGRRRPTTADGQGGDGARDVGADKLGKRQVMVDLVPGR